MAKTLHWRYAYERRLANLRKVEPGICYNKTSPELMSEDEKLQDDAMWARHRAWEEKYSALNQEYEQKRRCTCRLFSGFAQVFDCHAWGCPVNDNPLWPSQTPKPWSFLAICEAKRERLQKSLDREKSGFCVNFTGQWFNSGLVYGLPDLDLICPVWLDAKCRLYHLPTRICKARHELRMALLTEEIARLDVKISMLAYHGCTCRLIFGFHSPWCPARGKGGIPMK
jgi:hypothetical protein